MAIRLLDAWFQGGEVAETTPGPMTQTRRWPKAAESGTKTKSSLTLPPPSVSASNYLSLVLFFQRDKHHHRNACRVKRGLYGLYLPAGGYADFDAFGP
ncbi:uncharacterized protein PADG_08061 [Paracoccidioides brasiliensis Pb18]|uniref:Uncharacterized protein n=1 Tax=Paracoccidioides brasiliensis (strain Pb18) TaxID=502780 RepID=C1GLC5_PARBD|nr:uncharacterized protein PADG_08061 [Paracoccidioides brasiliensis Pb18]EEH43241.1 hypothetical protein PADG_08061 [Paracoccidioides brasiliensis Pb18]